MPRRNCLALPASLPRTTAKCSGAKLGMGGNSTGTSPAYSVSPGRSAVGVDQADHVAGEGLLDGLPVLPEHGLGVLGGERAPGRGVGQHHAALEPARAHPDERHPVPVRRVHVGLHLEHQAGERRVDRPGLALDVLARGRRGSERGRPRRAGGARRSSAARRRTAPGWSRRPGRTPCRPRGRTPRRAAPAPPAPRRTRHRRGPAAAAGSRIVSSARPAPPGVRSNVTYSPVARSTRPRKSPAIPTGQFTGAGCRPIRCSISSSSSSGSRPGRSHLFTNVITGTPRLRHTSNSFSVCGSRPLAESSSMIAQSTADSTR